MAWISFGALPCRGEIKTWWWLAFRCCWNRGRPWHASELVSFLVGLRTYQHPGITKTPTQLSKHPHITKPTHTNNHTLQNPHIQTTTHYKTHTYKQPHITKPTHTNNHTLQNKLKQPEYKASEYERSGGQVINRCEGIVRFNLLAPEWLFFFSTRCI